MLTDRHHLQVFWPVVVAVAIDMMHGLGIQQWPAEHQFGLAQWEAAMRYLMFNSSPTEQPRAMQLPLAA